MPVIKRFLLSESFDLFQWSLDGSCSTNQLSSVLGMCHPESEKRSQLNRVPAQIKSTASSNIIWASSHLSSIVHKLYIGWIVQFVTISMRIPIYNNNTSVPIHVKWNSSSQTKPCLGKSLKTFFKWLENKYSYDMI